MFQHYLALASFALAISGNALAQTSDGEKSSPWQTDAVQPAGSAAPRMIQGNDRVLGTPARPPKLEGAASSLKFEAAPILEVVRVILGDILKADYVMHQPINGSVTLSTRRPVTPDQAMFLLESALQTNGLVMGRDTRGVYHVGPPEILKSIVPAVRQATGAQLPPGYGAIIVPLQYIGATEMATILRPMVPPDAIVRVDTLRNVLIMAGSRSQAEGWLEMVSTFDINLLQGMSVGVFELKHATIAEVETALRLFSTSAPTIPGTGTPATPGRPAAGATPSAGQLASGGATAGDVPTSLGPIRVMPIARINSILVMTPRAAYLEEARRWIEKLDQPSNNSMEPGLFVYPVQNSSARHIAEVLNGIFGGTTSSGTSATGSGVAPGLNSAIGSTSGFNQSGSSLSGNNSLMRQNQGQNQGLAGNNANNPAGVSASTLITGVRVVADEVNNSVLIYANRREFDKIEATIRRLDLQPTQVLIEASIIEVTLRDGLEYGLQWFFNDKSRNGLTGTGTLGSGNVVNAIGDGLLGGAPAGFSYTLRNSIGDIRAVLNALADKSLIKVISSPSLMVQDNFTAAIMVGTQQPIRTGETITSGGNVSTSIQYKDTGVNLQVTPSVNAGNIVNMLINQAVTDVGAVDAATSQRSFLQRQISSKVAVRSGEALVLGGLIRDNTTSGKAGIPVLQDIPVVGALFGSNSRTIDRTELLVVITPRVVRNDIDAREISAELRVRMKSLGVVESMNIEPRQLPPPVDSIPVQPIR